MWMVLALGCVPPEDEPIIPLPEPTPSDTTPLEILGPSYRIIGLRDMDLRLDVEAVPASGEDPSLLLLSGRDFPDLPETFIVPGHLPPGEHGILEVWDGISSYTGGIGLDSVHLAGDIDDDGISDLWLGNELHLGPILGRELVYEGNPHAWIEEAYAGAAGFDSDGDGHEDLLAFGVIYHGPFEGELPSPSEGTPGCYQPETHLLPDHLGPGRPLVSVRCDRETRVYELQQPREQALLSAESVAWALGREGDGQKVQDVGDLDGDGQHDLFYGGALKRGPAQGSLTDLPDLAELHGGVLWGMGDLNGDSVEELVGLWERAEGDKVWVVLFSPHADPIDLSSGLPVAPRLHVDDDLGSLSADLDGDGLRDLIGKFIWYDDWGIVELPPERQEAGEILVWYGKDLLAAHQAR